jgi:hypothetical protein
VGKGDQLGWATYLQCAGKDCGTVGEEEDRSATVHTRRLVARERVP